MFLNVYSDWARAVEAKSQMLFPTDLGEKGEMKEKPAHKKEA